MPTLPNARHERFAHGLAKGLSADEAYQKAGYGRNRGNASRMKANENVAKRVAELQEKAEAKVLMTLEEHMNELKALRDIGKENGQTSAAISAEVKRGELMGYYVERRENTNTNYNITDKPLSEDDWEHQYGVGAAAGPANGPH